MDPRYQAWIEQNVPPRPHGLCGGMTAQMLAAFPELIRVRGHYRIYAGSFAHWWLTTADGQIIDPTIAQFPDLAGVAGVYEPLDESKPELIPIGKCYNCGELYYPSNDHGGVCSEECYTEYAAELTSYLR